MADKPIIFSGPMVRAILDGRKTQTRRVLKNAPDQAIDVVIERGWIMWRKGNPRDGYQKLCDTPLPYQPGDRLWVREKHWAVEIEGGGIGCPYLVYDDEWSDGPGAKMPQPKEERIWFGPPYDGDVRFGARPGIHMPRWASRLTLAVTAVKVERLQEVSEEDARAEGAQEWWKGLSISARDGLISHRPEFIFSRLWNTINAKREGCRWEDNPWIVAVTFKPIMANIDNLENPDG